MATFHPAADHFDELLEPLTDHVRVVADALSVLDDSWSVYVRPHIGQDIPYFLLVHDHFGVIAVEVVGSTESESGRAPRDPVVIARRHRSTIYEHFFAFPGDAREPSAAVRVAVAFPYRTRVDAEALLGEAIDGPTVGLELWGSDDLDDLGARLARGNHVPPTPASIGRLRRELVVGGIQPPPITSTKLSSNAQLIARNPGGTRLRGVTGPAGSGKSFALTARAAHLAAEGKQVLVLCFNLTLANRLRSLTAVRCAELGTAPTRVTCTSFHTFCSRVVDDAVRDGIVPQEPMRGTWPARMLAKTNDVFEQGFDRRFDAVLVDEGQDFTLEWWNLLRRHVVRPGGEMLLVSDPMVDLGGKQTWADPDTLAAAGFVEPWIELSASYRMAPALVDTTNGFAEANIEEVGVLPVAAADQESVVGRVSDGRRTWRNVARVSDLGAEMGRQVVRLLAENENLRPRDVVYLCEYHHDGLAAAAVIEAAGHPVHHVYSRDPDARHLRKGRFWPGADAVKGCTVHSFKGWESPAVVIGIGVEERSRRLAYASMTRVSSTHGFDSSHLVVVNADPRIADFQPTFELGAPLSALT